MIKHMIKPLSLMIAGAILTYLAIEHFNFPEYLAAMLMLLLGVMIGLSTNDIGE